MAICPKNRVTSQTIPLKEIKSERNKKSDYFCPKFFASSTNHQICGFVILKRLNFAQKRVKKGKKVPLAKNTLIVSVGSLVPLRSEIKYL